ncbi:MAG TPA: tRNA (adenosine(37)-N6)-threonylcarbamoyltransferase complex dimerization subunit type 1 TsaB [Gaiellales bacterium]|nr:tRNA (adenosine(37)-N6)-threonylcarbamoyltransferase complex dimerization subunit type 1 TsaB [Gaiellales bacterium]
MLLLALDTATDAATACLSRDGEVLAESMTRGRSTAAQRLLDDVHHLTRAARLGLGELDAIVAGTGPGTFTGLRIGLASARALGFGLGIPVHGVSTLDALLAGDGVDVACIDARRGEVFCKGPGIETSALAPDRLAELLPEGAVVAGDGAVRYREQLRGAIIPGDGSPLHVPWARHHASLSPLWGSPDPLYVRAPDADRSIAAGAAP